MTLWGGGGGLVVLRHYLRLVGKLEGKSINVFELCESNTNQKR